MTPSGQTLCLSMIVKNEAPVIGRCLASVRPLVDHWLIVDTGSTDGTQAVIRAAMEGLPGELVERPWVDFAHNRSEALALARPHADYTLIIDADDTLEAPEGFTIPLLTAGGYTLQIADVGMTYSRTQIVRNDLPWRYEGVLHEYLTCEGEPDSGGVDGLTMRRNHDGARRKDPQTYRRDAAILEEALTGETKPFLVSRYRFYLAQSYRDCGMASEALENYLARADLGFWIEEVFVALLNAARLQEQLNQRDEDVLATYRRAADAAPTRAEALHGAARYCRMQDRFEDGYRFAALGAAITTPSDGLFVEPWIYAYGLLDELAVNGYWAGRYRESLDAALRGLESGQVPEAERPRFISNMRFAFDKLPPPSPQIGAPPSAWAPTRPLAGTELMVEALRERLGATLNAIDLCVNLYDPARRDGRPLVLWMHHDIDQAAVQWLQDPGRVAAVDRFVFVSTWQMERYLAAFGLDPARCVVLRHAVDEEADRRWTHDGVLRCAYTSTPFRGLDILLDVWDRLRPANAELHIWSSMKLYMSDDGPYEHLFERARAMPGVTYHGLVPNDDLRAALRTMHILAYPNTFAETACRSVIEAMAAGCRVIVPAHGALPETTGGFARLYRWTADREEHADLFAEALAAELAAPWGGQQDLATAQQTYCATTNGWPGRIAEWRRLIEGLVAERGLRRPNIKKVDAKRGTFYVTVGDFISETVANSGDWEPHLYRLAQLVLTDSSNVLDLGANFGYHTIGLARLVPKGLVFAFEPLNLCFSQMQMNVLANGLDNVRAYKMAVTDRSGEWVEMDPAPSGDGGGQLNIGMTAIGQGGETVPTVRLDDMSLPRIDFIKADIQGAETEALDGMRRLIDKDRPILFIEIEEAHLSRRGSSSKTLIDRLLSLDYTLIRIRTEWPTDHIAIPNERTDIITQIQGEAGHEVDLLMGSSVELTFQNNYFYSTFRVAP
jgi:FkbM family methyltransferase